MQPNCLAFTLIQVPVVYHIADNEQILITKIGNEKRTLAGQTLDEKLRKVGFNRSGEAQHIEVYFTSNIH